MRRSNTLARVVSVPAALLAAQLALPALAEQTVTFNVPVQLSNLYSDVKTFSVGCIIQPSRAEPSMLGHGRVDRPVSGGSYQGVVHVAVSVPESHIPDARYWVCRLYLFRSGSSQGCIPELGSNITACSAQPGTKLVTQVEGPLEARRGPAGAIQPIPTRKLKPR